MVYELLRSGKIKDYEEAKKNFRQAQADYTKKRAVLVLKVNELQEKKAKYAKDEKSWLMFPDRWPRLRSVRECVVSTSRGDARRQGPPMDFPLTGLMDEDACYAGCGR